MKTHIENFCACVAGCLAIAAPFLLSAFDIVKG